MPIKKISDIKPVSGWFLVKQKICRDLDHDPSNMIVLKPGIYEHVCPSCNKVSTIVIRPTFHK